MTWVKWSDRKPPKSKRCDFLYNGDAVVPCVWIRCNSTRDNFLPIDICPEPDYWRPAEQLPKGIRRYTGK